MPHNNYYLYNYKVTVEKWQHGIGTKFAYENRLLIFYKEILPYNTLD